jgi:hypothetical protein
LEHQLPHCRLVDFGLGDSVEQPDGKKDERTEVFSFSLQS